MATGKVLVERRRVSPRTISEILSQLQREADETFNGRLEENLPELFDGLEDTDQHNYLRSALRMFYLEEIRQLQIKLEETKIDGVTISPIEIEEARKILNEPPETGKKRKSFSYHVFILTVTAIHVYGFCIVWMVAGINHKSIYEGGRLFIQMIKLIGKL